MSQARETVDGSGDADGAVLHWTQVDWRRHLRNLPAGGSSINFVDVGSGEPVLLIHGLGDCWQNWLENIPALSAAHRVIAVDLPGCGHSQAPAGPPSIEGFADAMWGLCDRLGLDRVALVGNSLGGLVALDMAFHRPERVSKLVLVDSAGISTAVVPTPMALIGLRFIHMGNRVVARLAPFAARRPRVRRWLAGFEIYRPERLRPELVQEVLGGVGSQAGYVHAAKATLDYRMRGRLDDLEIPTLIVWGRHDRIHPSGDAEAFDYFIPFSTVTILEESGHKPMLEEPELFNEAVLEFLGA